MANIPLKSIKFPGLDDTYTVPQVDADLDTTGAAADAKATGDALTELNERLGDIEGGQPYAPAIISESEEAYNHSDILKPQKISFIGNNYAFSTARYADKPNLFPDQDYRSAINSNGVTYEFIDQFTILSGTATANRGDPTYGSKVIEVIPSGSYKLYVYEDTGGSILSDNHAELYLYYHDSNNNYQLLLDRYITGDSVFAINIPVDISKITLRFTSLNGNVYDNYKAWAGLYQSDVSVVDTNEIVSDGTYDYEIGINDLSQINTMQHKSTITGVTDTKTYVDSLDVDISKELNYLTPEMFGAKGDNATDDSNAFLALLSDNRATSKKIYAFGTYYVASPIDIGNNKNIEINAIRYTGNDAAVVVSGRDCVIKINSITSAGIGIALRANGNSVRNNQITVRSITAACDGISLESISTPIYNNQITFSEIAAGGQNYYCITTMNQPIGSYITENTFRGGHCRNADYAFYGKGGNSKFENFYVEDSINGGFWFVNDGSASITNDRHWECCYYSAEPYIKITHDSTILSTGAEDQIFYQTTIAFPANKIDVSGVGKRYTETAKHNTNTGFGRIYAPLTTYVSDENIGTTAFFSTLAYLMGDAIIFTPFQNLIKTVNGDLDLRVLNSSATALPTEFDIAAENCKIYLHSSYCCIGYNKFVIRQTENYQATVYDWYTGNVIFDGASFGAGAFEIEAYTDGGLFWIDGTNQYWRARKIE